MNAPNGWTAYLLGPAVHEAPGVLELPPQISDPRPPDRLYAYDGAGMAEVHLSDPNADTTGVEPVNVYVSRLLLAGHVVIYDYDHLGTARLQAGIPDDLPRDHDAALEVERRATVDRRLLKATPARPVTIDVAAEAAQLADVLDLPRGAHRRSRERAVLAEEDRRIAAAIAETTPNLTRLEQERHAEVTDLEAERRKPVPPRPGDCRHGRSAWSCTTCSPSPPARIPGAETFDPDLP